MQLNILRKSAQHSGLPCAPEAVQLNYLKKWVFVRKSQCADLSLCNKPICMEARPIEPTPILKGKDAARFLAHLEAGRNRKFDEARWMEICKSAKLLRSILKYR